MRLDEWSGSKWMRKIASLLRLSRRPVCDESRVAFKALRAARTQGTMVDVGAHFGGSLARFARAGWWIVAFEPDSENRKRLAESFGGLSNVIIDPRGVSDQPRERVTLYRSDQSTGISGLSAFHSSHVPGESVDLTTLEGACVEHGLSEIDFLKIDTEGFDLPVLKGLPWNRVVPRLILCEFEDSKTKPLGYAFHDLARFLEARGYKLIVSEWYPVKRYGGTHDWRGFNVYPCELSDPKAWGNVLAARDDDLYHSLLRECDLTAPTA